MKFCFNSLPIIRGEGSKTLGRNMRSGLCDLFKCCRIMVTCFTLILKPFRFCVTFLISVDGYVAELGRIQLGCLFTALRWGIESFDTLYDIENGKEN